MRTALYQLPFTRGPLKRKSLDRKLSFGGCQSSAPPVLRLLVLALLSTQLYPVSSTFENSCVFETCGLLQNTSFVFLNQIVYVQK